MESAQSQQRRGGLVPISPSQTPRSSDRAPRDPRPVDSISSNKHDKDKGVNVQVLVRCRPLSEDESRMHTPVVISCNESRREVSAIQTIANKQIDRTFAFDKVFGPTSQQKELYDLAVSPIVNEVLEGYNCTIFAYGQTGTGKTYTMEGGARKKNGEFPSDAGVIPRAVKQIFDILEAQNAEYNMKVTFLELYNEEITDLLAPEETSKFIDDKSKKPIALMEDGKGGVFVRGLEEEIVCSANEIYKILEKGSAKRRTAETLLNKQSSRSHSIFSITIHIKECTPEGEEMIKCGKLNLVDLAGSENISRSGAREGRAREAGEINKSLLTLGRVINALVEHSGHVPYRDSKLTRLLRDSLGGKTKTCIIATISPSIHCLEESLSTLDYAHRAKNIKNKPEINQKMMKSALIKDLYTEIDRLKQEVYAAREKNGIYIPRDRYLNEEAEKKAMTEKIERMELDSEFKDKQLMELQELYDSQQLLTEELGDTLDRTEKKLELTEHAFFDLEEKHSQANAIIKEKEFLINNLLKSEKALIECAFELRAELENAASDVSSLFGKIERKDKIEDGNKLLVQKFQFQLTQQLELLHKTVAASVTQQEQQLKDMEEDMQSFVSTKDKATQELRERIGELKGTYGSRIKALNDITGELEGNFQSIFGDINCEVSKHSSALEILFNGIASEAEALLSDLQSSLHKQEEKLAAYAEHQHEAHGRAAETTRCVSIITSNFIKTLNMHASKLTHIVEEAQSVNEQKLSELEKKFEECAANEEKQLLEKVAELLASSNARKKQLVQTAVCDLRESATSRTNMLQLEMSTMQECTSAVNTEWALHLEKTESNYLEDISAVEHGKRDMEEVLQHCLNKGKMGAEQWRTAQESLLTLEKNSVASVNSIFRDGMESNQMLRSRFSSAACEALEDVDSASRNLLSSVEHSLGLDNEACGNLNSMIAPCCQELRDLKCGHYHKVVEITEHAGTCLLTEYMIDEPSCSTPRKRSFNLPSIEGIEELRTPAFDELLKSSWDLKHARQSNGDVKHLAGAQEAAQSIDEKMMKSALIKDLCCEIGQLKQEACAARETSGIYIPQEYYLKKEAEKAMDEKIEHFLPQAMDEKIEHLEFLTEFKDNQLIELQELYDSQQLLTEELSDNLGRTEKKLEATEHAFFDLEEKLRQANTTIKDKEFLITNLLNAEKAFDERAFELRPEVENAASNLTFDKIERKSIIEGENKSLVQKFQCELSQQLELLDSNVAASVTQQEQQLKNMEEDMQSFVSRKFKAAEEVRERIGELKATYGSRVKALNDITGELEGNFQTISCAVDSEVSKSSFSLDILFNVIASEAEALLCDLQNSLHKQEEKLTAYTQQQYEAHARSVKTTQCISEISLNFINMLEMHASKLINIVEDSEAVNEHKLRELEKNFEECTANEEKQLLDKVAELLAYSNARQKELVQKAVCDLRESAMCRTEMLQEMSTMQECTYAFTTELATHLEETESDCLEETSAIEHGMRDMEEVLQDCLNKAKMGVQQWRAAQKTLLCLEENNVASVTSIFQNGMESNQDLRARFSSAACVALDDVDNANKILLSYVDHSVGLDKEECGNLNSMIASCCEELRDLKCGHYHKIVAIIEHGETCLLNEYMVAEPFCSTPRRRSLNLPSLAHIEELRDQALVEQLKSSSSHGFRLRTLRPVKIKRRSNRVRTKSVQSAREPRAPLTEIN